MLNFVLRRGLSAGSATGSDPEFVVAAHKGGFRPGVDPLKLNQLIDQLKSTTLPRKRSAGPMTLPDINLLVYAYNDDAPHHASARRWWETLSITG
jgi:hypothetical protein